MSSIPSILVIDDAATVRQIMGICIKGLGRELAVTFAENGVMALELLQKNSAFDLIVSDVMMPEMDGARLCRHLAATPQFATIPMVMLTSTDKETLGDLLSLPNVIGYMQKPLIISDVRKQLRDYLDAALKKKPDTATDPQECTG